MKETDFLVPHSASLLKLFAYFLLACPTSHVSGHGFFNAGAIFCTRVFFSLHLWHTTPCFYSLSELLDSLQQPYVCVTCDVMSNELRMNLPVRL